MKMTPYSIHWDFEIIRWPIRSLLETAFGDIYYFSDPLLNDAVSLRILGLNELYNKMMDNLALNMSVPVGYFLEEPVRTTAEEMVILEKLKRHSKKLKIT